jgi:hypothetical protein
MTGVGWRLTTRMLPCTAAARPREDDTARHLGMGGCGGWHTQAHSTAWVRN